MTVDVQQELVDSLKKAFGEALGLPHEDIDPIVRKSSNPEHGDYQANGAMGLGKKHGINPKELASKVVAMTDFGSIAEPPTVAGGGFINIRLAEQSILLALEDMDSVALGIEPDPDLHAVAIDLCGVNVAKQLHVGHLRSTIIGDALARMFERVGRTVYRENHLGDWGLPIAMVLERLLDKNIDLDLLTLDDLNASYQEAQLGARDDEGGLVVANQRGAGPHRTIELKLQNESACLAQAEAKKILNALQQGDSRLVASWQKIIDCTMQSVFESLDLLNVKIGPEHNRGESFYRDRLGRVVEDFKEQNLAVEDDGALVVRFGDRQRPMLIQKSDGGYLYATTDLAAIAFRTQELKADMLIYVVDARQRDHFNDLFDAAAMIGWNHTPDGTPVEMVHAPFGSVLGEDKKPLKTRSGSNVTLTSLLQEAIERGTKEVQKRSGDPASPTHGMSEEAIGVIGRQIGIGAIKYADLSNDLVRDYVFDMDRMIAFEGNTGPYIQYACARIRSLIRKGDGVPNGTQYAIDAPQERQLALQLIQYNSVLKNAIYHLEPHGMCTWLYELTESFNSFYQSCAVLKGTDEKTRSSRLKLADLTLRVLVDGLDVLGIETPQKM